MSSSNGKHNKNNKHAAAVQHKTEITFVWQNYCTRHFVFRCKHNQILKLSWCKAETLWVCVFLFNPKNSTNQQDISEFTPLYNSCSASKLHNKDRVQFQTFKLKERLFSFINDGTKHTKTAIIFSAHLPFKALPFRNQNLINFMTFWREPMSFVLTWPCYSACFY